MLEQATVFPLFPIVDGRCGCGNPACEAIGKHPAIPWRDMPAGKVVVREGCGKGLATGQRSKVFVVDEDTIGTWLTWLTNHGETVDTTFTVSTPRPGRHYYYTVPDGLKTPNTISELAPGLDTRGDGGYVVFPGSPHASGGTYEVLEDVEPIPMPKALLGWLEARSQGETGTVAGRPVGVLGTPPESVTQALVESIAWPDKGRHATQRALAGALVHSGYEPQWIVEVLTRLGGDQAKRQRTVAATVAAYEAGDPTEGWPALARRIPVEQAQAVLRAWCETQLTLTAPPTAVKAAEVRAAAPAHAYSYRFNEVRSSTDDPTRATYGALLWHLSTDDDWYQVFEYDTLRGRVQATRPPMALEAEQGNFTRNDCVSIAAWFDVRKALTCTVEMIRDAVNAIARTRRFSPLVRYLDPLGHDGQDWIGDMCAKALRLKDPDPIYVTMVRKTLIASVARAYRPGAKVDTCLVLQGEQNAGKSTTFKALWGEDYHRAISWTNGPDMTRLSRGAWVVELDELDGLRKADQRTVKAWLSRNVDSHVKKFEENASEEARGFVVCGSSNEGELLSDPTGERRWWIVPVGSDVDHGWIKTNRDAIWGQAKSLYLAGEPWYLTEAQDREAQALAAHQFKAVDPIEATVAALVKDMDLVDPTEIACTVFARPGFGKAQPGELKRDDRHRVAGILRGMGFREARASREDRRRVYKR